MESWELRTGIEMLVFVIVVGELYPTVLAPNQSVGQNTLSTPIHRPK